MRLSSPFRPRILGELTVALAIGVVSTLVISLPTLKAEDQASEVVKKKSTFDDISIEDLKKRMTAGTVTIIDCLPYGMYQNAHIPRATHLRDARKAGLETVLPVDKDALVLTYCGGPG